MSRSHTARGTDRGIADDFISSSLHGLRAAMLAATLLFGFTGCGQSLRTASVGGAMYPAPPAEPRIQFVTAIAGTTEISGRDSRPTIAELLFGAPAHESTPLMKPYGMAARDGKLYVCDVAQSDIFILDLASDRCVTWKHDDVRFSKPVAIRFRPDDNLEVCDAGLRRIFLLSADGTVLGSVGLDTLQPGGAATPPESFKPVASIDGPNGASAVLNAAANRIDLIDLNTGRCAGAWSGPGSGPGQIFSPTAMAQATDGSFIVADMMNRRLARFGEIGQFIATLGEPGDAPGYIAHPRGVAVDDQGIIYVTDAALQIVQMFDDSGEFLMSFGGPDETDGGLLAPAGVCIDRSCLPYVQDRLEPGFDADYLIFVSNQMGSGRISVYAFGRRTASAAEPAG